MKILKKGYETFWHLEHFNNNCAGNIITYSTGAMLHFISGTDPNTDGFDQIVNQFFNHDRKIGVFVLCAKTKMMHYCNIQKIITPKYENLPDNYSYKSCAQ